MGICSNHDNVVCEETKRVKEDCTKRSSRKTEMCRIESIDSNAGVYILETINETEIKRNESLSTIKNGIQLYTINSGKYDHSNSFSEIASKPIIETNIIDQKSRLTSVLHFKKTSKDGRNREVFAMKVIHPYEHPKFEKTIIIFDTITEDIKKLIFKNTNSSHEKVNYLSNLCKYDETHFLYSINCVVMKKSAFSSKPTIFLKLETSPCHVNLFRLNKDLVLVKTESSTKEGEYLIISCEKKSVHRKITFSGGRIHDIWAYFVTSNSTVFPNSFYHPYYYSGFSDSLSYLFLLNYESNDYERCKQTESCSFSDYSEVSNIYENSANENCIYLNTGTFQHQIVSLETIQRNETEEIILLLVEHSRYLSIFTNSTKHNRYSAYKEICLDSLCTSRIESIHLLPKAQDDRFVSFCISSGAGTVIFLKYDRKEDVFEERDRGVATLASDSEVENCGSLLFCSPCRCDGEDEKLLAAGRNYCSLFIFSENGIFDRKLIVYKYRNNEREKCLVGRMKIILQMFMMRVIRLRKSSVEIPSIFLK